MANEADNFQAAPDDAPLLIVIGCGGQPYREYILRSAAERYRLWLIDAEPVTWQRRYVVGATAVDPMVATDGIAAAQQVAASHEVTGVFCYDEGLIWPASQVADALGLPGNPPEVVRSCRDKAATRAVLEKAGVPQAASTAVTSLDEAREAAERIGFPVVLKPRGLAGSKGVQRADGPDDMEAAYAAARGASYPGVPVYDAGVLVEEYLDGPEISVDSVFFQGECLPMVVARKDVGFDPFFEELGHIVIGDDPLLRDDGVLGILRDTHAALGWHTGITHTEVKLTSRGPRLIEVNARLGGDLIPYLGLLANGIDCSAAGADVAAGVAPDVTPKWSKVSGITFLYPREDCEVVDIEVHEDRAGPNVHQAFAMAAPGMVLRLPPRGFISRYGFVIAVADDEATCRAALGEAETIIELSAVPLGVEAAK